MVRRRPRPLFGSVSYTRAHDMVGWIFTANIDASSKILSHGKNDTKISPKGARMHMEHASRKPRHRIQFNARTTFTCLHAHMLPPVPIRHQPCGARDRRVEEGGLMPKSQHRNPGFETRPKNTRSSTKCQFGPPRFGCGS